MNNGISRNNDDRIAALYRKHFAKLSGLLVQYLNCSMEDAEDTVQAAFLAALEQWSTKSPSDELAWLYRVCRNLALKKMRDSKASSPEPDPDLPGQPGDVISLHEAEDAQLAVLFSFTSDHFAPRNQLILTLRFVCGLSVSHIAAALGMQAATVTKTIQRSRADAAEKIRLRNLSAITIAEMDVVIKTIYLLFNEGYKSSQGRSLIREQFCEDALYLTRLLLARPAFQSHELEALYAMMLFHIARFESRSGLNDEIIDLESQDRSAWNKEMIQLGAVYLEKASHAAKVSQYHLQAAIAWLHVSADDFRRTPWNQVLGLQQQLYKLQPSPFVQLNLAVTYFYSGEFESAGKIFTELSAHPYISNYYLFQVAYGKYLLSLGLISKANACFTKAANATSNIAEKNYIAKLAVN